jgi:predicted anti-sigma-YlaC factor YlaD
MARRRHTAGTYIVIGAAVALHAYEYSLSVGDASFALKLMAWQLMPYAICLAVLMVSAAPLPLLLAAAAALCGDLFALYTVFLQPGGSSTTPLLLLSMPVCNAIAAIAVWIVGSLALRKRVAAGPADRASGGTS